MNSQKLSETVKLLHFILFYRRVNRILFGLLVLVAVILTFFVIPKQYTAELSILPSVERSGLGGQLGNLANLAGLSVGDSPGGGRSQDMYRGIIYSRRLLEQVVLNEYTYKAGGKTDKRTNLIDFLEIDEETPEQNLQKTLKIMREDVVVVDIDPDNQILYLFVTLENPQIAAQAANLITEILDNVVLTEVQKELNEQYTYLNQRILETNDSLNIAEKALQVLLEKEINPALPEFQIEQLRARREIELQTAISIEMRKQLELLYLDNFYQLSSIKVLDPAYPPYKKSRPRRALLLISLVLLFGLLQTGANWGVLLFRRHRTLFAENMDANSGK